LLESACGWSARVGNQNIDASKSFDTGSNNPRNVANNCDIGRHSEHLYAAIALDNVACFGQSSCVSGAKDEGGSFRG
jgi:hypothetical protein